MSFSIDQGSGHPSFYTQSASNGDVINALFGVFAVLASAITIWQGHKTWKMWREHYHAQTTVPLDLELGGSPLPYTSPELPVNRPLPNGADNLRISTSTDRDSTLPPIPGDSEPATVTLVPSPLPVEQEVPSADMQLEASQPSPSASGSLEPLDASPSPMNFGSHTEGSSASG